MAIIYLNQYTLCASASLREFSYDSDGNLLSDGVFTFAYDAGNFDVFKFVKVVGTP